MPPAFLLPSTVVVDCGASRTAVAVFRRGKNGICLREFAVEFHRPAPGGGDDWLGHTRRSLLALRPRIAAAGPVALVLPAHLLLTRFIRTPRVGPVKREKIIRFEAAQNIPYELADVVWDSAVVGERDAGFEVMLAATKLDAVEPLCAAAQATGFDPQVVLPSPVASLAGFRLAQAAAAQSVLVLNLGARSTTLLLVGLDRFVARTLSLGGNSVTQQVAANQDCDLEEAEAIKLSGQCRDLLADAREILATRLTQEIARSLLHFRRQGGLEHPARVCLTGGGASLAGFDEALAAKLKLPVGLLGALGSVEVAGELAHEVVGHDLILGDLIGAASLQLRPGRPVLNLLPPCRRSQVNLRRRQPWLMVAAVLAVAALLPPVVHLCRVAVEAQRKTAAIERELVPLRGRAARNQANLHQLETLKRDAARLQAVHDRRAGWLNLLADLQDRLVRVEDVWLEKLSVQPAVAGEPVKLVVSGRMLDRTNPLSKVSPETFHRVKTLFASFVESPFVARVESERFDNSQPGILQFDFVLVTEPQGPL
jgi:type IV pilus assembly protein PilM